MQAFPRGGKHTCKIPFLYGDGDHRGNGMESIGGVGRDLYMWNFRGHDEKSGYYSICEENKWKHCRQENNMILCDKKCLE